MTPCGAVVPLVQRWVLHERDGSTSKVIYAPVARTGGPDIDPSGPAVAVWQAEFCSFQAVKAGHWCADHCHIIGADDLGSVTVDQ